MLLSLCLLTGCSSRSLREALHIVGEADSLWQQGLMYDDSTQLAQTYNMLHAWRAFYTDEYAHACYHYGKLLRAKEDPVSAMQVFIDATHSRTHDYHILGRVYSNMGSICHLAGEYSLSYDMYQHSAEIFLHNNDTIAYYYAVNDMAYELAERGQKDSVLALIETIENKCSDTYVLAKTWETRALLYRNIKQYDSVIYAVDKMETLTHDVQPTGGALKAHALWFLSQQYDALVCAKHVLSMPDASRQDRYNMLYIIINGDTTLRADEIKALSEQRADLELKELVPLHNSFAVAVNLLEQDLSRKPDWKWLYAVCLTLCIIGVVLGVYIRRKHQKRTLLSQQIYELEIRTNEAIAHKRLQIISNCALYSDSNDIRKNLCWNDYDKMCHIVDQQFYMLASKLRHQNMLNEKELRLCILVLLNLSRQEISEILPYALSGIGKLKDHTAKKLGSTGKNLHDFLLKMAIEG
jgi:tetratricopeptide (TPR) repeat protein